MLSDWVAVALELSFTCTVKLKGPAVLGVPVMLPFGASDRPDGRDPAVVDQVYPPAPPVAVNVCWYGAPITPFGRDVVLTVNCGGAILMLSAFVAVALELSFTCTVKLAVPAVEGSPVM